MGVRLGASRVHVCDIVQFMELTLSESCTKPIVANLKTISLYNNPHSVLKFIFNCSTDAHLYGTYFSRMQMFNLPFESSTFNCDQRTLVVVRDGEHAFLAHRSSWPLRSLHRTQLLTPHPLRLYHPVLPISTPYPPPSLFTSGA